MKYERVTNDILRNLSERSSSWRDMFYSEVRFWNCQFTDCSWTHCKFQKTNFANGTRFTRCRFEDCRFTGQHTHLGGPSVFTDCEFVNCLFRDITFSDAKFVDCLISGKLENIAIFGPEAPKDWRTVFKNVNLSQAELELVDFRCGFDLTSTIVKGTA